MPSPAAETRGEHWSAGELARVNACRKARAVSRQFPDALVIGVDTLVAVGTAIFGKPRTRAEARGMLAFLQGRTHQVTTGVCLVHWRARRQKVFFEQTDVTFRALTPAQIRRYHQKVNPLDKAGAYGIQEHGRRTGGIHFRLVHQRRRPAAGKTRRGTGRFPGGPGRPACARCPAGAAPAACLPLLPARRAIVIARQ